MCENRVLFKFSGIYPANINIVVFFFTHLFINFVCAAGIFCSEVDQNRYVLPEIQERLAESLRLPQSPVVHEQIFLFFRVLTLRMSAPFDTIVANDCIRSCTRVTSNGK